LSVCKNFGWFPEILLLRSSALETAPPWSFLPVNGLVDPTSRLVWTQVPVVFVASLPPKPIRLHVWECMQLCTFVHCQKGRVKSGRWIPVHWLTRVFRGLRWLSPFYVTSCSPVWKFFIPHFSPLSFEIF
jgi:hypothetical protein